jgi:hypothetical protein
MQDDVGKIIYGVLIAFMVIITAWIGYVFIVGCGFSLDCEGYYAPPERTPIPTLIPAKMPVPEVGDSKEELVKCRVSAESLLGAWASEGYPESEAFSFSDVEGTACTATYVADVQPLFVEANLWFPGSLACSTCHHADIATASTQLDMSSYAGVLAGSWRASADEDGTDILGGGVWEESILYDELFVSLSMPFGRPPDLPAEGPVIFAGSP